MAFAAEASFAALAAETSIATEAAVVVAPFEAAAHEAVSFIRPAIISASVVSAVIEFAAIVWTRPRVIPRPRADEHSVRKPVRTVISVWSASIRIVGEISVRADWRPSDVARAETDTHAYSDFRL
jgi:hypothetical protein